MEKLRDIVTETYWDSREEIDILKRHISQLQDQLMMEERMLVSVKADYDYMWDQPKVTNWDMIEEIASRYGVDPDEIIEENK